MDLSVIVAATDAGRSIEECLRRLQRTCRDLDAELIVVDASRDDTAARAARLDLPLTLLRCRPGTLTPQLWAAGYRRAAGRFVAFTTGHCLVARDWAASLTRALEHGATGAGGPLVVGDGTRPLDRAVYYLRYSAFTPHTIGSHTTKGELAGDNVMYVKSALDRHAPTFARGFWELDFHRLVRADGGRLEAVPDAVAAFGRSFPAATILHHRFLHGTHFGAGRVDGGARSRARVVLAAPLVPIILAARAARRVVREPGDLSGFLTALPWLLLLAAAWAAGEATGALAGAANAAGAPVLDGAPANQGEC